MNGKIGVLKNTDELKRLIEKYPDYPIAVLCGECSNGGDYTWMYASDVRFEVGEMLDCEQPVDDEQIFNDKDYFYEQLEEWLFEVINDVEFDVQLTEEEFRLKFEEEKAKYEPYWKKCIFIKADN